MKKRNKKYKLRRGPLVIVNDDCESLVRALKNVKSVDTLHVRRLNIKHLAPGGVLGRLCVFTASAMEELRDQFGSFKGTARYRKNYLLKREVLTLPDVAKLINSDAI